MCCMLVLLLMLLKENSSKKTKQILVYYPRLYRWSEGFTQLHPPPRALLSLISKSRYIWWSKVQETSREARTRSLKVQETSREARTKASKAHETSREARTRASKVQEKSREARSVSCCKVQEKAGKVSLVCRVGQNRISTPYMIVYLVISLPKIPYMHCIYMVLANPTYIPFHLDLSSFLSSFLCLEDACTWEIWYQS